MFSILQFFSVNAQFLLHMQGYFKDFNLDISQPCLV
jgi:hypothetical protein